MFISLATPWLIIIVSAIVAGAILLGIVFGRWVVAKRAGVREESLGAVQGTLLGVVGLLLAFGLSMAVSRYDARRDAVVSEANAIGTTYLRAQLLAEPQRSTSLDLLKQYGDAAVSLAQHVAVTKDFAATRATLETLQNKLWAQASAAVKADPQGTAPRLYVETLNDMIDQHTVRVASLGNRVPTSVMVLELIGSAVALGALAMYLTLLGKSLVPSVVAAAVIVLILLVSFDLDRPRRGFIKVPSTPLVDVRASMNQPPAAPLG
jgi:hypothetical protein